MKAIVAAVAALSFLVGMLSLGSLATAHGWYPKECCGGADCAAADTVVRRSDGSYLVTMRDMSVLIPRDYNRWQQSPDGRIHVCISEHVLFCAFRGPSV
jgi:hypothetical protein